MFMYVIIYVLVKVNNQPIASATLELWPFI